VTRHYNETNSKEVGGWLAHAMGGG